MESSRNGTLFADQHSQFAESVIGGEGGLSFDPHIRCKRWGEEGSFALRLPDSSMSRGIRPTLDRSKIEWLDTVNNIGMRAYSLPVGDANEHGGLEFEILLAAIPATPTLALPFESSGLTLHWQPPLTREETDRGVIRPANVVNSIAAYHATRTPFHFERGAAQKYKTGKAWHLYRPEAIDANGVRHWVDWSMDRNANQLILTFDDWFLTAAYPVAIDPTVGYTTHGGTEDATEAFTLVTQQTPTGAGDANPGTAIIYAKTSAGTANVYLAAYSVSGGTPWDRPQLAESSAIGLTTTLGERSAAITWTGITTTAYWIALWSNDSTTRFYFDAGGATGFYRRSTAANPTDPFPASSGIGGDQGSFDNRPSGWVDFAAGGGGLSIPVAMNQYRQRRA